MAPTPESRAKSNMIVLIAMGAVQLFGAFQAVMVTANEYDPSTIVWMNIGLDSLLTLMSGILLMAVLGNTPSGGLKPLAVVAGIVGVVAGLVKLGPRFMGDDGWWTGHYSYALGG
ncbi:MAG: hypothetical protein ACRCS3_01850 [Paracoccaceae bacterium]